MENVIHIVLRLLHIVAALGWVGMGLTLSVFVANAERLTPGDSAFRFAKHLFNDTPITRAIPISALLTTVCGLLLYSPLGNAFKYFSSTGNIVLGIGAAAGLLAFGHGFGTGAATGRYAKALADNIKDGQSVPAETLTMLAETRERVQRSALMSLLLMVIALIGMSLARYL
jgi:hypothetical protein